MKNVLILLSFLILTGNIWGQSPQGISYQAVIRDVNNKLITDQSIGMQISILQGSSTGSAVYTETQTATTNTNGLVTLQIGSGATTDNFSAIHWADGPYFLLTKTDPTGGTNYSVTGNSQLLSVPYALFAASSNSPQNAQLPLAISHDSVMISKNGVVQGNLITYDGTNWVAQDLDVYHPIVSDKQSDTVPVVQPYLVLNFCIALTGYFPSRSGEEPFVGEIDIFSFNFAPVGWAICNGQLLSISQNEALFALIGTTYGGDGLTTFALPDLQGRVPINFGSGNGLTPRVQGASGGVENVIVKFNDQYRK